MPLSTGVTRKEVSAGANRRKQRLFSSPQQTRVSKNTTQQSSNLDSQLSLVSNVSNDLNGLAEYENQVNGFQTDIALNFTGSTAQSMFPGIDESMDQVFSPPLLMDTSFFPDAYEDLLGMLIYTLIFFSSAYHASI